LLRAYKYRIYPTIKQIGLIEQHFDACRIVYNLGMEVRLYAYSSHGIYLNSYDLNKQLPDLKKANLWFYNINSQSLQDVFKSQDTAFTNFYKYGSNFPKFRSKKRWKPSFKSPQHNELKNDENKLKIKKFPEGIKISIDRIPKGQLRNVTISKSSTNKYYASLTYENGEKNPVKKSIKENHAIGIDLGLIDYATLSNGQKINNPKFLNNHLQKIKILQRRLAKKQKSSNRYKLHQHKINLLYEKIKNQKIDFLHKLSNQITNDYDTICIEDLNIVGMLSSGGSYKKGLNRAISDANWYEFRRQLTYKCDWKGKNLLVIGRFQPSSKLCDCGIINGDLKLSDREWKCLFCGKQHDRDILAANNIKKFAILNNSGRVSSGVDVELPTLVGTMNHQC